MDWQVIHVFYFNKMLTCTPSSEHIEMWTCEYDTIINVSVWYLQLVKTENLSIWQGDQTTLQVEPPEAKPLNKLFHIQIS